MRPKTRKLELGGRLEGGDGDYRVRVMEEREGLVWAKGRGTRGG